MVIPTAQEIITFDGLIDTLNVVEILNDIEVKAEEMGVNSATRKKIFNIAVEGLQNLLHHTRDFSVPNKSDDEVRIVQFAFSEDENQFLIETSKYYEVVIFTAALPDYANFILDIIDKKNSISYKLYREHTIQR